MGTMHISDVCMPKTIRRQSAAPACLSTSPRGLVIWSLIPHRSSIFCLSRPTSSSKPAFRNNRKNALVRSMRYSSTKMRLRVDLTELHRAASKMLPAKTVILEEAFAAGQDVELSGPSPNNCHYSYFENRSLEEAWWQGRASSTRKRSEEKGEISIHGAAIKNAR